MLRPILVYEKLIVVYECMRANCGVWGAESAIHHKPHSVHSLPGNTLGAVPLICMAAMVQI